METHVKLKVVPKAAPKVVPIIEYQPNLQYTPRELVQKMNEDPELDTLKELIVIVVDEKGFVRTNHASKTRDLLNCKVLWNLELAKAGLLASD